MMAGKRGLPGTGEKGWAPPAGGIEWDLFAQGKRTWRKREGGRIIIGEERMVESERG